MNHIAREIKRIDPHHPTMTVIAELGDDASKVKGIERFCPDIDIIGLNSYGGIESIGDRFVAAEGTKPYIVTEHGTLGPWECGKTSWGSPIELTSTAKADWYANGYRAAVLEHSQHCLGSYAFLWGHKQETTATWFGMLLEDGTKLGAVDAMSEAWTGNAPKNRCPKILDFSIKGPASVEKGSTIRASVKASDPDGDSLTYRWILLSDSGTIGEGGDPQEAESTFESAVDANNDQATITMPEGGGGYRLFVYLYDGQGGAAVANIPLRVDAPIELESEMPISQLPYSVYSEGSASSVYVPSGYMGNAAAISMDLGCSEGAYAGQSCIQASYNSSAAWGGVLWQSPAEDWDGKEPGGANLTGATHLEFWARGEEGGEIVNFVFGVLDGNQRFRDTAKGELEDVKLTKKWQKLSIPLKGLDLRQIKTGFGWSLAGQGKPVTFYLDEIRYVAN